MSSLDATLERLYSRRNFGVKLGLDSMELLLEKLGNPQQELACIHVAGTNGKGSVCAILESVLCEAGLRPGMYTSPHLVRFNERFRVDRHEVDDEQLSELVQAVDTQADAVAEEMGGREITFFEFATAMAFEHFRRCGARLVVLETGLGGRLDATNVVTPLVSAITRIDFDHTTYLGDSLAAIAAEKAGIIKPGRPVVCGAMPGEAGDVIRRTASECGAPLTDASAAVTVTAGAADLDGQKLDISTQDAAYGACRMPLLGKHQVENVATAVAVLETAARATGLELSAASVKAGLGQVWWPARFQVLEREPAIVLDGAHNRCGAEALVATWRNVLRKTPMALILARGADRDDADYLQALAPLVKRCWTVPVGRGAGMSPDELAAATRSQGWETTSSTLDQAITEARTWARENSAAVCITGSLYLAGEVLKRQKPA